MPCLLGEAQKEVEDEDACLHAAEEVFSLHAPVRDAIYFMVSAAGGESCRKVVKRVARRRHRVVDVREREGKSYLYDMVLDLILSQSWT